MMTRFAACAAAAFLLVPCVAVAQSQLDHPVGEFVGFPVDSGKLDNPTDAFQTVFSRVIEVKQSAWVRLYFSGVELAPGSYLEVTSFLDGETQRLDAESLDLWSDSTAYFNGAAVLLELHAAPHTIGNRVAMKRLAAEFVLPEGRGSPGQCGICSADDRTPSTQAWSGRLMPVGCTASVFCEDSTLVSAGHCIQSNLVMQFNVPASQANCGTVNPPVADQFPIIQVQSQNGGVGADWAVLRTGPNSLNQTAYERQNDLRRITTTLANSGQAAQIFGYGVDSTCVRSQTQQFSPGTIAQRTTTTYRYSNDVRGGNSGSGFIVDDRIVGIVTHCNSQCTNIATRHDVAAFVNARNALSLCDNTYTVTVQSTGAVAVPVQVSPADNAGSADGVTTFSRVYPHFTQLTLTAPETAGNTCFLQWVINGAPVEGNTLSFTVTGAATAVAQYAPCCDCDWNADFVLNSQDFFDFLGAFFDNNADFNDNGVTDSQDFFDFVACFFAGC